MLVNNNIGDKGAAALASALRVNEVLTELNIGGNEIGPEGAKAVGEALAANRVLTNLDLSWNNIGDEGATALASALEVNGVLKILDVRRNEISGDAAQPLATAVLASPSLEIFGSVPLKELRANTLDQLVLRLKSLGVPEALVLAKLVEGSRVLTSLDLGINDLTEEAALGIVRVERQRNKLTSLGLARCRIGPTGAAEIAEYVSGSGVLKSIDLQYNSLGDEGKGAIHAAVSGREGFELQM